MKLYSATHNFTLTMSRCFNWGCHDGPTAHWSDDPLVQKRIGPTTLWSAKVSLVQKLIGPKKRPWSEWQFVARSQSFYSLAVMLVMGKTNKLL